MANRKNKNSVLTLYPYQQRWLDDSTRFKGWVKSRQIGASFVSALELVLDCVAHKTLWLVLSVGERQSREYVLSNVKPHVEAIGLVCEFLSIERRIEGVDVQTQVVKFPNGSRIIAIPANPDTARGYSGNVLLDEFAFHRDARKIWKAIFPTVTRGGYKLRVISTLNGRSNMFYELVNQGGNAAGPEGLQWSIHRTDIYEAEREGMPVNVSELRAGVADEDTWREEYECVPLDDAEQFIPMELILSCEAEAESPPPRSYPPLYWGIDIGRKRDLTVAVGGELVGDVLTVRRLLRFQNATFAAQRAELELALVGLRRACVDSTGLGMQLGEELAKKFGGQVEQVTFNLERKEALAVGLKRRFEDRTLRIPVDRKLRAALRAVKRYGTATGHFRFDAERTDAGHADEFWALALLAQAASGPSGPVEYRSVQPGRFAAQSGGY